MYERINFYKFYSPGRTIEIMSSKVFCIFFIQIKIPKRKRNAETFFQRKSLLYVLLLTNKFLCNFITFKQFSKLNFNLNLSLKIIYKDKITDIKKIPCKIATVVNVYLDAAIFIVFRQFLKPLATSNTCIFVNIAWKINCDILKSKLILS